jgi:glycogen phosphorylase
MGALRDRDWWMIAADFRAYWDTQRQLDMAWRDRARWDAIAVRNTARMGWFSSDRSIREYAHDIWRAGPDA